MWRIFELSRATAAALITLALVAGCRRGNDQPPEKESGTAEPQAKPASQLLLFPSELRAEDESVNEFVRTALARCAAGDYDAFRRLWTARQDPLPRDEFDEGWKAVQSIRVRALEKAALAPDRSDSAQAPPAEGDGSEIVYVLLAEVMLDPAAKVAQREPRREVVLMLTREHDEWRLARAPKAMRAWVRSRAGGESSGARDASPPP